MRIGFDRDKYLRMQSSHIAERRAQFGGKLYLEFGGKLIDDMHASRVLPGFTPDNKIVMLADHTRRDGKALGHPCACCSGAASSRSSSATTS